MRLKRFFWWSVGLLVMGIALLLLLSSLKPAVNSDTYEVRQARNAATLREIERNQQAAEFWQGFGQVAGVTLLAIIGLGCLGVAGLIAYERRHRHRLDLIRANTLTPTPEGNYPVRFTGAGAISLPPGNLLQPVPHSLNYAPHFMLREGQEARLANPLPGETNEARLPERVELLNALRLLKPNPARLEIFFGQGAGGPLLRALGEDITHIGLLGATGSGKSSQAQSIFFQLAHSDPTAQRVHFGFLDLEGKTSRPFRHIPHTLFVADELDTASLALLQLEQEMNRRARLPETELSSSPTYLVLLEEFLALRDELGREDWQRIKRLAIQGRKSKMYLVCASQTFYSDQDTREIKGSLRLRNAFALEDRGTAYAFGIKDSTALASLEADPRPGRFLQKTAGGLLLAQAPYISEADITRYLGVEVRTQEAGVTEKIFYRDEQDTQEKINKGAAEPLIIEGELGQAAEAWRNGANSVRKLAEALGVSQYRSQVLIGQLRVSYSHLFDNFRG